MEEEYIDYSCSTPVERLSRDIETTLRSWHISDNDRHVAFSSYSSPIATTTSTQSGRKNAGGGVGVASTTSEPNLNKNNKKKTTTGEELSHQGSGSCVTTATNSNKNKNKKSLLLREKTITLGPHAYILSLHDDPSPIQQCPPPPSSSSSHNNTTPLSLQRCSQQQQQQQQLSQYSPISSLTTLSSLFGIGQHLTLISSSSSSSQNNNNNNNSSSSSPLLLSNVELQMALNIACHECSCRIPAFALVKKQSLSGYCVASASSNVFGMFRCDISKKRLTNESLTKLVTLVGGGGEKGRKLVEWGRRYRFDYKTDESKPFCRSSSSTTAAAETQPTTTCSNKDNNNNNSNNDDDYDNEPFLPWGPSTDPLKSYQIHTSSYSLPSSSSSFHLTTTFHPNLPSTPLSASLRCLFASLIRSSLLDDDVLLAHLTSDKILSSMYEQDVKISVLGNVTARIVSAMSYKEMRSLLNQMRRDSLEETVKELFRCRSSSRMTTKVQKTTTKKVDNNCEFIANLPGGGGRSLLTDLCREMARMKTPSGMACLWMVFVRELRRMWEEREPLGNLGGGSSCGSRGGTNSMMMGGGGGGEVMEEWKVGSAFLCGNEEEVDLDFCLLGQKLQVLNFGIENTIASERRSFQNRYDRITTTTTTPQGRYSTMDIMSLETNKQHTSDVFVQNPTYIDNTNNPTAPYTTTTTALSNERNYDNKNKNMTVKCLNSNDDKNNDTASASDDSAAAHDNSSVGSSSSDDFFDTVEDTSQYGGHLPHDNNLINNKPILTPSPTNNNNTSSNSSNPPKHRRGARCPIKNATLQSSSDQLYAPYLLRPPPLTLDHIIQRRSMQQKDTTIPTRLLLAHREQKPRLLSDMKSFKAANPTAIFSDFTNWYGNPDNPLDDLTMDRLRQTAANDQTPLDAASEAIQILMATRDFWAELWEEAEAEPACEQQPLWDATTEVEMVLFYFESWHPSLLMNQVLGCYIVMAYEVLKERAESEAVLLLLDLDLNTKRGKSSTNAAAAADQKGMPVHVRDVRVMLDRLRNQVLDATTHLEMDVRTLFLMEDRRQFAGTKRSDSSSSSNNNTAATTTNPLLRHISVETLESCEQVCNLIGDFEFLLSRAISLLNKFPREYELVQTLLRCNEVEVMDVEAQETIMRTLGELQQCGLDGDGDDDDDYDNCDQVEVVGDGDGGESCIKVMASSDSKNDEKKVGTLCPRPAVKELIYRYQSNNNDENGGDDDDLIEGMQLTAIVGDDLSGLTPLDINGPGSLLALTKVERDH